MIFRVIVPEIAAGEPLSIAYIDLAETRRGRRRALQTHYFFDIDAAPPAAGPANHHTAGDPLRAFASYSTAQHSTAQQACKMVTMAWRDVVGEFTQRQSMLRSPSLKRLWLLVRRKPCVSLTYVAQLVGGGNWRLQSRLLCR
jgi:hypothetical protein